jgi:hypothetical protein
MNFKKMIQSAMKTGKVYSRENFKNVEVVVTKNGWIYFNGSGFNIDDVEACDWFQKDDEKKSNG